MIEEARNAEACRSLPSLQKILQPVWSDFDQNPDFAEYDPPVRAELLRLCGFFLSFYGRSKGKREFQARGKDLLTCAIEIFQKEGLKDKAAEASVQLAFCYWNAGEAAECEAILDATQAGFADNRFHPVYVQIRINRLMTLSCRDRLDEALEMVVEISKLIDFVDCPRLKAMYYIEAGIIYCKSGIYNAAAHCYQEAAKIASSAGNLYFVANASNNLALVYRDLKKPVLAHSAVDRSLKILRSLDLPGWVAVALDTKALIYIDEGKTNEALEAIEEALRYFFAGEEYSGLVAALWTKCQIQLELGRTEEALTSFARLDEIASQRLSESAAGEYRKMMAEKIYVLRSLPLPQEVAELKKMLVRRALKTSGGNITKASRQLGLKNHQNLSDILNNQFPELIDELKISRRSRRKKGTKRETVVTVRKEDILDEREIFRLVLKEEICSFDFDFDRRGVGFYYFGENLMRQLGAPFDAVVALIPVKQLCTGMTVLVSEEKGFVVGKVEFDNFTRLFFILDERQNPIPLDKKKIIGEPVAFCPMENASEKLINFSRLAF